MSLGSLLQFFFHLPPMASLESVKTDRKTRDPKVCFLNSGNQTQPEAFSSWVSPPEPDRDTHAHTEKVSLIGLVAAPRRKKWRSAAHVLAEGT